MRLLSMYVWTLLAVGTAAGAEPRDLLVAGDAKLAQAPAWRYAAELRLEGPLAEALPALRVRVLVARGQPDAEPRWRMAGELTHAGGAAQPFEVMSDGTRILLLDRGRQQYRAAPLPQGHTWSRIVLPAVPAELAGQRSLVAAARDAKLAYAPSIPVGETECRGVALRGGKSGATWYFAGDGLPCRVEREYGTADGVSRVRVTFTEWEPVPVVPDDAFRAEPPAEYADAAQRQKGPTDEADAAADGAADGGLLPLGMDAPPFSLRTPDGRTVTLESLRGRVVVLDFWATWCGPCRAAMPGMQKLHEMYRDRPVTILGLNTGEPAGADPAGYMRAQKLTYTLLLEADPVARLYKARGLPTFYVIGPDGRILMARSGFSEATERRIRAQVQEALDALDKSRGLAPS